MPTVFNKYRYLRRALLTAFFLFLLFVTNAQAGEKILGKACTGDTNVVDYDSIVQCVDNTYQKAPLFAGNSNESCDSCCASTTAGLIRWTGTALQGCDGSNWMSLN